MGTFLREKYPLLQGNLASLDQRVALTEPFKWEEGLRKRAVDRINGLSNNSRTSPSNIRSQQGVEGE